LVPVFAVYSTFLQRGFDQLIHDVCMQNINCVFAIDRAGIVGADGETHQGIFDLSYLSMIPNMVVTAPKSMDDLPKLLEWAVNSKKCVAIRYPRGGDQIKLNKIKKIEYGKWEEVTKGKHVTIIATGKMVQLAYLANKTYKLDATIVNALFVKPLDEDYLDKLIKKNENILTIEDNILNGGLVSQISFYLAKKGFGGRIISMGFDDCFVPQGSVDELYKQEGLTIEKIKSNVEKLGEE
jgi:1-deoxy-D-xylulose-5-phosphate synthase